MGHVDPAPAAFVEIPLPWGPVVRGVRWGAGPDVVLMLHEPGADLGAWGSLPARLAHVLGAAVVAVDLPGHGLSDDPWEPDRCSELVPFLMERAPALTPLAPSPIAMGEGDDSPIGRSAVRCRLVISAGDIASVVHASAVHLGLAGMIALSPAAMPPSPIAMGEGGRGVRAALFFAGSLAEDDLATARKLASASRGWSSVTSIPASERGTALLATPWQTRIEEEITAFLRDCLRPRPPFLSRSRPAPPRPG